MGKGEETEDFFMEKYAKLESYYLKYHYFPHLLLAVFFCLVSGGFMSFRNLNQLQAAQVMEMYVILTGIILFVPVFMPEQDQDIWSLERSKSMPMWKLYFKRTITAAVVQALIISGFVFLLKMQSPVVEAGALWSGGFCEALFLGSIGYFCGAVLNQVIIGYMISILFFAANIGLSERFGVFGLFQMMRQNDSSLLWKLAAGVLLLIAAIALRERLAGK